MVIMGDFNRDFLAKNSIHRDSKLLKSLAKSVLSIWFYTDH